VGEPRHRPPLNITLSPRALARLERLLVRSRLPSKSQVIEDLIDREWTHVGAVGQALDDIHEMLDALSGAPCAASTEQDYRAKGDCGNCPSCRARAALEILDHSLSPQIGVQSTLGPSSG